MRHFVLIVKWSSLNLRKLPGITPSSGLPTSSSIFKLFRVLSVTGSLLSWLSFSFKVIKLVIFDITYGIIVSWFPLKSKRHRLFETVWKKDRGTEVNLLFERCNSCKQSYCIEVAQTDILIYGTENEQLLRVFFHAFRGIKILY